MTGGTTQHRVLLGAWDLDIHITEIQPRFHWGWAWPAHAWGIQLSRLWQHWQAASYKAIFMSKDRPSTGDLELGILRLWS